MDLGIDRHLGEDGRIAQGREQLALEEWAQIQLPCYSVIEAYPQSIASEMVHRDHAIDRMYHAGFYLTTQF
jgi:hypothetical protein